jgi:phytoene dehydrogenase-like protein
MNIVVRIYDDGGKRVATTTNIDKMARTAREMTEAQRDSYEALAENFAAAQRRNVGLAQDGLEFLRLQEDNARAAQEWFANGARLLQLQQRNAQFFQRWFAGSVEALRDQTEHNLRTAEVFAQGVRRQQEGYRALTQDWTKAYQDFFSPFAYATEGLKTTQRAARQGLQATQQVTQQGLRLAEETAEQTEKVLRETVEATEQAELQTAVFGALGTSDYEDLTVDEVSKKLDGLTTEQLRQVREFEKRNKNRETLIGQIDRKIKANS